MLRHLEAVGCDLALRVLGIDERGREILTYFPDTTICAHLLDLPERSIRAVGRRPRAAAWLS